MKQIIINLFILVFISISNASGQEIPEKTTSGRKLRVYMEGEIRDFDYQRRNIKYVDFVQDPKIADIHMITTKVDLGSGGRRYYMNFYSGEKRDQIDIKQSYIRGVNETDDQIRVKFRKSLEIGLLHYLNESDILDQIDISYTEKENQELENHYRNELPEKDPWNLWVFKLSGSGGWSAEENKNNLNYSGSVQADRITETWLMRGSFSHDHSTRNYKQDEEVYKTTNIRDDALVRVVYALSKHWSTGLFLNVKKNTYLNIDLGTYLKPAIEYNLFDWKDADQKTFTISYLIGPSYYNYYDITFLNKTAETLWEQSFLVQLEMIKPWGEIETKLSYEGFLTDLRNYNLSSEIDLSFRISKGISVFFELSAESIHSQLYLPKNEISIEELLLNSRKLPTSFEFGGEIGFRVYFGSIYNNFVNERL